MSSVDIFDIYNMAVEKLAAVGFDPYPGGNVSVTNDDAYKVYRVDIPVTKAGTCITIDVSYEEAHGLISTGGSHTIECDSIW